MPKSHTVTTQIHRLFTTASQHPVTIRLPSRADADTLRHRLYSARKTLRLTSQSSHADLVELVIRPSPTPSNPLAVHLIARPLDANFDTAITEALGPTIPERPQPTDPPAEGGGDLLQPPTSGPEPQPPQPSFTEILEGISNPRRSK